MAAPLKSPKFTEEAQDRIFEWVRRGAHFETAAASAGVNRRTLTEWVSRGRKGEPGYAEFVEQLDHELSLFELKLVAIVSDAASAGNASAAQWMLDRRFAKRWHDRAEDEDGVPVKSSGKPYTPEELRTAASKLDDAAERARARMAAERAAH